MRNEHRKELESGDELVVAAEAGVEIAAIKNPAVIETTQPSRFLWLRLNSLQEKDFDKE